MEELLAPAVGQLVRKLGSLFEGDVFAVLRSSPWVCRAYEFALVDGCLDCASSFDPLDSWALRFCKLERRGGDGAEGRRLLCFDVKSRPQMAISSPYMTTMAQSRWAAFYIGISAADPSWVEVIPNYSQTDEDGRPDHAHVAVDCSSTVALPPTVHGGLAPSTGPHRMPLSLLGEALRRVRAHVRGFAIYENPWTGVRHPDWTPIATSECWMLRPKEESQMAASCQRVLGIATALHAAAGFGWAYDFVGLQPSLADAKFVNHATDRQVLVEHKTDSSRRVRGSALDRVPIARTSQLADGRRTVRWYCSSHHRFDFLLYQFCSPDEMFLLPEHALPDAFYTATSDHYASFERDEFQPYRIPIDPDGAWVERVARILDANPAPRAGGPRPIRAVDAGDAGDAAQERVPPLPRGLEQIQTLRHRQLWWNLMAECAARMSGLVLPLPTGHTMGDLAFCSYAWADEERRRFLLDGTPPRFLHSLPADAPLVCLYIVTRDLECDWHGPLLRSPRFQRLDSSHEGKLVLVDLFGTDEPSARHPWAVIPSEDIQPTREQRRLYQKNLAVSDRASFLGREPSIHAVLSKGLTCADYAVSARGPSLYDGCSWSTLWALLHSFTQARHALEHPAGHVREPRAYRTPLRQVHEYTFRHGLLEAPQPAGPSP